MASYEIRKVVRISHAHVQLEARFFDGPGELIMFEGSPEDGWELVDINPFTDEPDLRRQLEDILRRKVAMLRVAEPLKIDLGVVEVGE